MRKIQCGECRKIYDFDIDDFCPKCGAFNQPSRAGTGRAVLRKDGLNENDHKGSFVHAELHRENWKRRSTPLVQHTRKPPASEKKAQKLTVGQIISWIILAYIALGFLRIFL